MISVCNWSSYQSDPTSSRSSCEVHVTTNKKIKKVKNKEKDYASQKKVKPSNDKWQNSTEPFTNVDFIEKLRGDKRRHINIIAEYADQQKIDFKTKGQWYEFIKRNVRCATKLAVFSDDQLSVAMKDINQAEYLKKYTLETLHKFLVK